ncbi:MAG: putative septation protein SpoVG [Gemmatimonadota bacterium]|nr:MAG: putative septation protein SpoVG [Gemmatimonadota bacterium]
MDVTDIRISLRGEEKLKAYVTVTFDHSFVVRGLRIIGGQQGLFVAMPSRTRPDGTYQDIAHPIHREMRVRLEESVLAAYHAAREDLHPEGLSP